MTVALSLSSHAFFPAPGMSGFRHVLKSRVKSLSAGNNSVLLHEHLGWEDGTNSVGVQDQPGPELFLVPE